MPQTSRPAAREMARACATTSTEASVASILHRRFHGAGFEGVGLQATGFGRRWALGSGLRRKVRTLDAGPWTLDAEPWTPDPGLVDRLICVAYVGRTEVEAMTHGRRDADGVKQLVLENLEPGDVAALGG